jgi:hypothetical protein
MLAIQIDNPTIENSLKAQFPNIDDMKQYIYELVLEDFEDKQLLNNLKKEHKKDFVSKDDIFKALEDI